jgi:hypothetical protein
LFSVLIGYFNFQSIHFIQFLGWQEIEPLGDGSKLPMQTQPNPMHLQNTVDLSKCGIIRENMPAKLGNPPQILQAEAK